MASAAPFSGSLLCLTKPGTPQPPCFSPPPSRSHFHLRTRPPKAKRPVAGAIASSSMAAAPPQTRDGQQQGAEEAMKLLFVEMGVGYDQHGQDITSAAVRACKDAISSNSIPAFRRGNPIAEHLPGTQSVYSDHQLTLLLVPIASAGSIPGVNSEQMKLQIKLGVPRPVQHLLDFERIKAVFP
ncbi:hypothetical protein TRIUR3_11743 [Triticum urartu]|uniref:Uncharacterized protein n=1 Tax=Triticum urartu TaxID=4572 RepID=M7YPQ9_TRIUA|nr:hypothetical protein TRIUR3_11743 [Triticum urartu]